MAIVRLIRLLLWSVLMQLLMTVYRGGVACACRHFRSKDAATHTMLFLAERAMAGLAAPALAPAATSAQHSKAQRRKGGAPAPASGSQALTVSYRV